VVCPYLSMLGNIFVAFCSIAGAVIIGRG